MRLCERVFAGVGQRREPGSDGNGNPVSVGCIVVGQDFGESVTGCFFAAHYCLGGGKQQETKRNFADVI